MIGSNNLTYDCIVMSSWDIPMEFHQKSQTVHAQAQKLWLNGFN